MAIIADHDSLSMLSPEKADHAHEHIKVKQHRSPLMRTLIAAGKGLAYFAAMAVVGQFALSIAAPWLGNVASGFIPFIGTSEIIGVSEFAAAAGKAAAGLGLFGAMWKGGMEYVEATKPAKAQKPSRVTGTELGAAHTLGLAQSPTQQPMLGTTHQQPRSWAQTVRPDGPRSLDPKDLAARIEAERDQAQSQAV